jgi:hypothetical protein
VYEELGGFFGVNYCEDWEMWIRIAAHFPVAYSPKCLALYRSGQDNRVSITCNSFLRGDNFMNINKAIEIVQDYLPEEKRKYLKNVAKKKYSLNIARATRRIYAQDPKVALVQAKGALKMHQNIRTIYWVLKLYLLHFKSLLRGKTGKIKSVAVK